MVPKSHFLENRNGKLQDVSNFALPNDGKLGRIAAARLMQNQNSNVPFRDASYLKAIGILKKVQRSQSLTVIFMLLNLLIFLAIGLNSEHVITGMVLTAVLFGSLSHRLSNSSCTGNCMCQKS